MFKIYKLWSRQIVGNFIMLLPLGIFLPLLYKRISNFLLVLVVSVFASTFIELLQLVSSFRSADVDDIFLNTLGACTGFVTYKLIKLLLIKANSSNTPVLLANS
jgi:glycopeptide antibiotics resistance protein